MTMDELHTAFDTAAKSGKAVASYINPTFRPRHKSKFGCNKARSAGAPTTVLHSQEGGISPNGGGATRAAFCDHQTLHQTLPRSVPVLLDELFRQSPRFVIRGLDRWRFEKV